jgi:hypothetical protein
MLWTHIREVLGSNLGTEINDWGFLWFYIASPCKLRDGTCPLSNYFQFTNRHNSEAMMSHTDVTK